MVSECSHESRSGPLTRTTPRWDRSTKPSPPAKGALLAVERAVVRRHGRIDAVAAHRSR